VPAKHLVLWDGTCGFCRRIIDRVRLRDRNQRFEFVPYQDAPAPPMTPELAEACRRAVHVITDDGRVLRGGRASLFLVGETGRPVLAKILSVPPRVCLVELEYAFVARHRAELSRWLPRNW